MTNEIQRGQERNGRGCSRAVFRSGEIPMGPRSLPLFEMTIPRQTLEVVSDRTASANIDSLIRQRHIQNMHHRGGPHYRDQQIQQRNVCRRRHRRTLRQCDRADGAIRMPPASGRLARRRIATARNSPCPMAQEAMSQPMGMPMPGKMMVSNSASTLSPNTRSPSEIPAASCAKIGACWAGGMAG